MKKWILAAVAAVLLAGGGWYFASPALAMSGLRDAVVAGDKDELAERVDFPSVRESLKSQFMAMMTAEMEKEKAKGNEFAGLGAMFATAIVGPMIDNFVTPSGLKAMVQHGQFKTDATAEKQKEQEWEVERDGLDHFRAVPKAKAGEKVPKLLFKRDGLSWRLVDIEIPDGGLGR